MNKEKVLIDIEAEKAVLEAKLIEIRSERKKTEMLLEELSQRENELDAKIAYYETLLNPKEETKEPAAKEQEATKPFRQFDSEPETVFCCINKHSEELISFSLNRETGEFFSTGAVGFHSKTQKSSADALMRQIFDCMFEPYNYRVIYMGDDSGKNPLDCYTYKKFLASEHPPKGSKIELEDVIHEMTVDKMFKIDTTQNPCPWIFVPANVQGEPVYWPDLQTPEDVQQSIQNRTPYMDFNRVLQNATPANIGRLIAQEIRENKDCHFGYGTVSNGYSKVLFTYPITYVLPMMKMYNDLKGWRCEELDIMFEELAQFEKEMFYRDDILREQKQGAEPDSKDDIDLDP